MTQQLTAQALPALKEREKQTMDTNQRIKELADMFQLTKAKSGT